MDKQLTIKERIEKVKRVIDGIKSRPETPTSKFVLINWERHLKELEEKSGILDDLPADIEKI